jgi:predicted SAM-dependent methyltransferase
MTSSPVRRLNWGCGAHGEPGWINSDAKQGPGIQHACDVKDGLPLPDANIDYAVSIHALQEIPYPDLVPVLTELRRVLKPGGILRLALPDLERAMQAYEAGDTDYFLIPDEDAKAIGAKMVLQLIWYGHSRTLFTYDFIEELLLQAGFSRVQRCGFRETRCGHAGITELDNREAESLFVEALR